MTYLEPDALSVTKLEQTSPWDLQLTALENQSLEAMRLISARASTASSLANRFSFSLPGSYLAI